MPERNETEKRYCIIKVFLIVAPSNETTNIAITATHTVWFPQCNAYACFFVCECVLCVCVCVCLHVCVCVCVCSPVCLCVKYTKISEKKDVQTKES